jgi:toxin ParE1/3/4
MTSRRNLILNPDAQADVRSILRYTARTWGIQQRAAYQAQLDEGMTPLVEFPERGIERHDLYVGCRALRVQQHIVYYRLTETHIIVGRILHNRQDPAGKVRP